MNLLASLRYLAALDEHKHFGRAAQACHITQPALSNALRALEEEFGTVIVRRGRNFEGFTPEGARVLLSAQRMLHERELLQQELDSGIGKPQGSLRVGAVPTAVPIAARFCAQLQARYPGIAPTVLSMSSNELEAGLESLSLDMGLGYTDRLRENGPGLQQIKQYTEHYFFVRRASKTKRGLLQIGPNITWADASKHPLCLLTREMHNRTIVENAFRSAGVVSQPRMETNSILTLALSVAEGSVCTVMPGALVGALRGYQELEALPLVGPEVRTAIGFMAQGGDRPSRTLEAALALAEDAGWLRHAAAHSGLLSV
ncbi:MAG TPA: LysR substrate-binding domain-containing protein [Polaromonas sp.]|uniref:LysR family transcriptional regulator n=1 Tax=Polaromonas sp. TaxID=1869339 RepID=UPI002D3D82E5|nr:LysR substrate-binding domain-containing protein [Polaromonas sp.]HYW56393.1 LysR substrate-binding domain-containing protein [Polaromonas sp.]